MWMNRKNTSVYLLLYTTTLSTLRPYEWVFHSIKYINLNSGVIERGLLRITKDTFITPVSKEITRVFLGALCHEDQIYIYYNKQSDTECLSV